MQPAAATCRLEPDGTLTIVTGAVDISGTSSGFAIIAAEAFGVPVERVTVITADTTTAPQSPPTNASAIIYASGRAVQQAAADARDRLLAVAAAQLEIAPQDLEIVDGVLRPKGSPHAGRPIGDLARELSESFDAPWAPVESHAAIAHTVIAPSAAAHLAHVRVDEETGQVELLGYVIAQDVGRALNPDLVEGQMQGGAAQSIGRALWEELVHDDQGRLLTGTFLDYAVPRATMLPPIDTLIVEVPAPEGPSGEGDRRGPDPRWSRRHRQRRRRRHGCAHARPADVGTARLGRAPIAARRDPANDRATSQGTAGQAS